MCAFSPCEKLPQGAKVRSPEKDGAKMQKTVLLADEKYTDEVTLGRSIVKRTPIE